MIDEMKRPILSEIRTAIKDFVARRRPNSPGVCIVMDETRWDAFVDYLTHRADLAMLDMPLDLWDIGPNGCPYAHFATLFGAAGPILLWPRDVESLRALSFHAGIKLFLDDMASAKAPPTPHMSSKFRRVGIGQSST